MRRNLRNLLLLAITLSIVSVGAGCMQQIESGQRGVEKNWGKLNPTLREEGLITYFPIGTDIQPVSIQQKTLPGDARTKIRTKDKQFVDINWNLQYRLKPELLIYLMERYNGDPTETIVKPRIINRFHEIFVKYNADELNEKKEMIKDELLATAIEVSKEEIKGVKTPLIEIDDLIITEIDFDDEYEKVIQQKLVQKEEAEKAKYTLERTKKEAEISIAKAKAEAEAIRAKAAALQNPNYVELEKLKVATKFAEKWDGKLPQYFINFSDIFKK